ncbi:hypothetical protein QYF36_009672 [Acer negundo]|nr:hypothetical protein QYF36_009672 [Acer negundo]
MIFLVAVALDPRYDLTGVENVIANINANLNTNLDVDIIKRTHQSSYPMLFIMARGLLTPPVSIVASESAFSAGGRTMTDRRTKLGVNSLKAVMCIRDWEAAEEREQGWQAMLEAEFKILECENYFENLIILLNLDSYLNMCGN